MDKTRLWFLVNKTDHEDGASKWKSWRAKMEAIFSSAPKSGHKNIMSSAPQRQWESLFSMVLKEEEVAEKKENK